MKIVKVVGGAVAGLIVLLIVIVLAALFMLDRAARIGIEQGGGYALGVRTTLAEADVRPFSGEFALAGLQVDNPEGFDSPYFMHLGNGFVALDISSIRRQIVELPTFTLEDVELHLLKKDGKTNYGAILESLKRFESGEKAPQEDGLGKKVAIRELAMRDIVVHVDALPMGGEATRLRVEIPEIRLTDVGTGDSKPLEVAAVFGVITKAILQAVVETAGTELPGALLGELESGLGDLASLGDMGVGIATDAAGAAVNAVGGAAEKVGEGIEEAGKGVRDAAEGIGDLLGGGKKNEGDQDKDGGDEEK